MSNPFSIGIVRKGDFCDRQREVEDLLRYARNGDNVVLFSPRRYGKSSLVRRVLDVLEVEDFLTVYVDLFPIANERDFIQRFSTAALKGLGRSIDPKSFPEKMTGLFKRLVPSIDFKPDGYSLSVKFDRSTEPSLLLDDLLEGIYAHVEKKNARAAIVLDEFQEITELPEAKKIEGTLRSQIQFHKEISYFYVGSRRRILKDIFTNRARPFYKSAYLYSLKEIPRDDFTAYIEEKFTATGKKIARPAAGELYDAVRGYPYYVQKLASICWDETKVHCTGEIVKRCLNRLADIERSDFEGIWLGLSLVQRAMLRALALEPTAAPYGREFLERYQLSVGGVQGAMKNLQAKDLVEQTEEGVYRVTDPVMVLWLREY